MHLANEDLNIVLGDGTFTKNFLNCHDDFDFLKKRNAHKTNLCNVNNALIKHKRLFERFKEASNNLKRKLNDDFCSFNQIFVSISIFATKTCFVFFVQFSFVYDPLT